MTLTAAARRAQARRRQGLWILFLLAPALLVMTLFVAWPLLSALRYAFFSFKGVAPDSFVGLRNFADVLIEEPFASWTWRALRHNIIVFAALMVGAVNPVLAQDVWTNPYPGVRHLHRERRGRDNRRRERRPGQQACLERQA